MIIVSKEVEKKVEAFAAPICADLGVSLWSVEFAREGGNWFLRVYIDRESGVSIDDCEAISRKLEKHLDEKDFIEPAYVLEVSSPGIDRPLRRPQDFEKYTGSYVDIKLYKAVNKAKQFHGKLCGLKDGVVSIETDDGETLEFEYAQVASCRLAVMF